MKERVVDRFTLVPSAISFVLGGVLVGALLWPAAGNLPIWLKDPGTPAWVQAVGSVAAIAVAIALPFWSDYRLGKTRSRELIELMVYSLAVAELAKRVLAEPDGNGRGWAENSVKTVMTSLQGIRYLETTHPVVGICIQQTGLVMATIHGYVQLAHGQSLHPTQDQLDRFFDRHFQVIANAIAESKQATGVSPRTMPSPPYSS